jgi:hypothetical protein
MEKLLMYTKVLWFLAISIGKRKAIALDMSGSMISFKKEKILFLKIVKQLCPDVNIITKTDTYSSYTDHHDIFKKATKLGVESLLYFTDGYFLPKKIEQQCHIVIPRKAKTKNTFFLKLKLKLKFKLKQMI